MLRAVFNWDVTTEERFKLLLSATDERLSIVDAALTAEPGGVRFKLLLQAIHKPLVGVDGASALQSAQEGQSLRLFRMGEACAETGLSRTTLWRAIKENKLATVEVRSGSHRISENELQRFVQGRNGSA